MDLDPAVFGEIAAADVFSATGDQAGTVNIQGRHVDAQFTSGTGGIGRLPGVPILTVSVPVLASARPGTVSSVTFTYGHALWRDVHRTEYSVTELRGTITVGGSLSIQDVVPGGGLVPAGTLVRIDGTGFTPATTLQIDGVSVSSTQFVNSREFNFTLGVPTDLTGKRLLLSNSDDTSVDHFSSLRGTVVTRPTSGPLATIQPIFPLRTYAAAKTDSFFISDTAVALENQTLQPVAVVLQTITFFLDGGSVSSITITLPPAGIYVRPGTELAGDNPHTYLQVVPAVPIRMAVISPGGGASLIAPIPVPFTQDGVLSDKTSLSFSDANPLLFNWQVGATAPSPAKLVVIGGEGVPFSVSAATSAGGQWLSVSPSQGLPCSRNNSFACSDSSKIIATVNPAKLDPGAYHGSITVVPGGFNPQPTVIPVVLIASTQPTISVSAPVVNFSTTSLSVAPFPATVKVSSNGSAATFSVSVVTASGQNWLSVTPTQGATPASLTVTANPKLLPGSADSGTITITGPANIQTISVDFSTPEPPPVLTLVPDSLQFSAQVGQPAPPALVLRIPPPNSSSISVKTDGSKWLQAVLYQGPGLPFINVTVDPTGLAPGKYQGSITASSATVTGSPTVPVTLTVWTGSPPAVTIMPAKLTFTAVSGTAAQPQTLNVSTGSLQFYCSVTTSTADGDGWLSAFAAFSPFSVQQSPTPTTVQVSVDATALNPGTYQGSVTITAPAGSTNSVSIPVTFTVTPSPPPVSQEGPPLAVAVVNAASQTVGAVSPGEIFTIFGQNIGPAIPAGFALDTNGKIATNLDGARVLFNGTAAPLLYASATQVNGIVPYEAQGPAHAIIEVEWNGTRLFAAGIPVAASAPAIFTLDGTGVGGGAVLNQDNSVNSPANPAARGSTIQIFGTGEGLTSPAGITGEVIGSDTKKPVQPSAVTIGGVDAFTTYTASAPDAVAGLFQVNAVVPQSITPGPAVPIRLSVGAAHSPIGVSVAVK